jgi:hypothetical protein
LKPSASTSVVTFTSTIPDARPPRPSLITYEKVTTPLNPAAGLNVIVLSALITACR